MMGDGLSASEGCKVGHKEDWRDGSLGEKLWALAIDPLRLQNSHHPAITDGCCSGGIANQRSGRTLAQK